MLRSEKDQEIASLKDRFSRMSSAVFLNYQGMTVEEVSKLRDTFRAGGVEYQVVKNTLVKHALKEQPYADTLMKALKGMTGVAWSYEEPSKAARIVKEFRRDIDKLTVKAGLLEGQVLDASAVENTLATMPSKDEARAMLLATMMAPAQRMVMLLNAPARNFVGVLAARERQG
jgi:large subunit ribosomal protein L10